MNRPWAPIATFFLGVLLTIGVYEGVRLVTNARQALTMASNQMKGEQTPLPEGRAQVERPRAAGQARAAQRPNRADPPGLQPRVATKGARPMGERPGANMTQEQKREALRAKLAELSPEQRQALMDRRAQRKERQRNRIAALQEARRQAGEAGTPVGPVEDPMHEPILHEADDELIDTGAAPATP